MPRMISERILRTRWSHDLFIRYFQELFGNEEMPLTRNVLHRMRFEGKINLEMWFEAQFPELYPKYQGLTHAINEHYWSEWRALRKKEPPLPHKHRRRLEQYCKHRAILQPKEDKRDRECIDVMAQILELSE
jgi:hypothetical protein